jgi:hypothetical protein
VYPDFTHNSHNKLVVHLPSALVPHVQARARAWEPETVPAIALAVPTSHLASAMLELASWDFAQWACIALCKEVLIYIKCAGHCGTGSAEDVFATAPAPPVANYDPSSAPAAPARVFKKDSVSDDGLISGIRRMTVVRMRTRRCTGVENGGAADAWVDIDTEPARGCDGGVFYVDAD